MAECLTRAKITVPICGEIDPSTLYTVTLGTNTNIPVPKQILVTNLSNGAQRTIYDSLGSSSIQLNIGENTDFFALGMTYKIEVFTEALLDPFRVEIEDTSTGDKAYVLEMTFNKYAHGVNSNYQAAFNSFTKVTA